MSESNLTACLIDINNFLGELIIALSDEVYTSKLRFDNKLFMYEDLNSNLLSMITNNFLMNAFSECKSHLLDTYDNQGPHVVEKDSYKVFKYALADILTSFHESNHLNKKEVQSLMEICKICSRMYSPTKRKNSNSGYGRDSICISYESLPSHAFPKMPLQGLLKWFMLLFEIKFIFGGVDINFPGIGFFD
ncbi:hypothetical protein RF11_12697 [Thelohanellus kitauei]|uniref:Uncharacterized protein n=1 Tax=Thelohanellus kitauei TaxID=669202 RepID=A0A0C2IMP4_THEKT|nr:hypothetical protein RF11_12697 [Thelohanellus kitauei]